ncbi:MAG: hypothetical protein KGJ23_08390 [Euryarchaeota archaeon]|nr:hypothetical protein [Euryarchaeota archaeon]MDE1836621.1 hypothetical protein [Euryarchaeota archaeon]MDE1879184.1 hypothetical protein [Euryarchaeota archaeon]MDE2044591.1 hypothetical protein [Thermoplasmata archaeon]
MSYPRARMYQQPPAPALSREMTPEEFCEALELTLSETVPERQVRGAVQACRTTFDGLAAAAEVTAEHEMGGRRAPTVEPFVGFKVATRRQLPR